MPKPYPWWYDANAKCTCRDVSKGHTTENFCVFKIRVQEHIDQKILSFPDHPNVGNNPLLGHRGQAMNVVEESTKGDLVGDLTKMETSMEKVCKKLTKTRLIKGMDDRCKACLSELHKCDKLKVYLQGLMDQGMIQIS